MFFMLIVTLTSLAFTIKAQFAGIAAGGEGVAWFYIRAIIAILLVVLAIVLVVEASRPCPATRSCRRQVTAA